MLSAVVVIGTAGLNHDKVADNKLMLNLAGGYFCYSFVNNIAFQRQPFSAGKNPDR